MSKVNLLNIHIDNIRQQDLLEKLKDGGMVVTPNVDHLVRLQKDTEFYRIYSDADYVVCDSRILMYASRFLGKPIVEKISGSDLFPAFYNYYKHNPEITIFLLGAAPGIAEKARKAINEKVGREMVIATYSPPFGFDKDPQECQKIVDLINQSGATVLAIGVGAPKQEKWLYKHRNQLKYAKILLAIGATIDFEAGHVTRSPKWMSEVGLEWFHRLVSEPERLWKRYLVDSLPFFQLIWQQKFNRYKPPLSFLLQEAGLLTPEQTNKILEKQKTTNLPFEQLVIAEGWLKPETVNFFLEKLPQLRSEKSNLSLSEHLKAAGLLNEQQINEIVAQQHQLGLDFEEILIRKGWVSSQCISVFLQYTDAAKAYQSNLNTSDLIVLSSEKNNALIDTNRVEV